MLNQRIPRNGTRVSKGERQGRVQRSGHPPGPQGVIVEVRWDDHKISWHPTSELDEVAP